MIRYINNGEAKFTHETIIVVNGQGVIKKSV